MSGATQSVEMSETRVSRAEGDRLVARGLGACVGVCLYDASSRLAAMVHVVLPETLSLKDMGALRNYTPPPGKCADTAVAHAVSQMPLRSSREPSFPQQEHDISADGRRE